VAAAGAGFPLARKDHRLLLTVSENTIWIESSGTIIYRFLDLSKKHDKKNRTEIAI
jgi:hypothetical protein